MIQSSHRVAWAILLWLVATGCLGVACLRGCSSSQQFRGMQTTRTQTTESQSQMRQDRPPTQKTLFTMANILATQGKDRQCEFVLRRCIQEYPRFMPAYNNLAELLMRQGRAQEAIAVLSVAIQIQPTNPVLLNNLGMCLMIRREYDKALDRFMLAAGLLPENKKYRANMAAALGLLGRHEESQALLQQVLSDRDADHNAQLLHLANERTVPPSVGAPG